MHQWRAQYLSGLPLCAKIQLKITLELLALFHIIRIRFHVTFLLWSVEYTRAAFSEMDDTSTKEEFVPKSKPDFWATRDIDSQFPRLHPSPADENGDALPETTAADAENLPYADLPPDVRKPIYTSAELRSSPWTLRRHFDARLEWEDMTAEQARELAGNTKSARLASGIKDFNSSQGVALDEQWHRTEIILNDLRISHAKALSALARSNAQVQKLKSSQTLSATVEEHKEDKVKIAKLTEDLDKQKTLNQAMHTRLSSFRSDRNFNEEINDDWEVQVGENIENLAKIKKRDIRINELEAQIAARTPKSSPTKSTFGESPSPRDAQSLQGVIAERDLLREDLKKAERERHAAIWELASLYKAADEKTATKTGSIESLCGPGLGNHYHVLGETLMTDNLEDVSTSPTSQVRIRGGYTPEDHTQADDQQSAEASEEPHLNIGDSGDANLPDYESEAVDGSEDHHPASSESYVPPSVHSETPEENAIRVLANPQEQNDAVQEQPLDDDFQAPEDDYWAVQAYENTEFPQEDSSSAEDENEDIENLIHRNLPVISLEDLVDPADHLRTREQAEQNARERLTGSNAPIEGLELYDTEVVPARLRFPHRYLTQDSPRSEIMETLRDARALFTARFEDYFMDRVINTSEVYYVIRARDVVFLTIDAEGIVTPTVDLERFYDMVRITRGRPVDENRLRLESLVAAREEQERLNLEVRRLTLERNVFRYQLLNARGHVARLYRGERNIGPDLLNETRDIDLEYAGIEAGVRDDRDHLLVRVRELEESLRVIAQSDDLVGRGLVLNHRRLAIMRADRDAQRRRAEVLEGRLVYLEDGDILRYERRFGDVEQLLAGFRDLAQPAVDPIPSLLGNILVLTSSLQNSILGVAGLQEERGRFVALINLLATLVLGNRQTLSNTANRDEPSASADDATGQTTQTSREGEHTSSPLGSESFSEFRHPSYSTTNESLQLSPLLSERPASSDTNPEHDCPEELKRTRATLRERERELDAVTLERDDLQRQIDNERLQESVLEQERHAIMEERDQLQERYEELRRELDSLRYGDNDDECPEKLATAKKALSLLEESYEQLREDRDNQEDLVRQRGDELESLRDVIGNLETTAAEHNRHAEEQRNTILQLRNERAELEGQIESSDAQFWDLEERFDQLGAELQAERDESQTQRRTEEELRRQLSDAREARQALVQERDALQAELDVLRADVDGLQADLTRRIENHDDDCPEKLRNLQAEQRALAREHERLKAQLQDQQAAKEEPNVEPPAGNAAAGAVEDRDTDILVRDIDALYSTRHDDVIAELREQIEARTQDVGTAQTNVQNAIVRIDALTEDLNYTRAELRATQDREADLAAQLQEERGETTRNRQTLEDETAEQRATLEIDLQNAQRNLQTENERATNPEAELQNLQETQAQGSDIEGRIQRVLEILEKDPLLHQDALIRELEDLRDFLERERLNQVGIIPGHNANAGSRERAPAALSSSNVEAFNAPTPNIPGLGIAPASLFFPRAEEFPKPSPTLSGTYRPDGGFSRFIAAPNNSPVLENEPTPSTALPLVPNNTPASEYGFKSPAVDKRPRTTESVASTDSNQAPSLFGLGISNIATVAEFDPALPTTSTPSPLARDRRSGAPSPAIPPPAVEGSSAGEKGKERHTSPSQALDTTIVAAGRGSSTLGEVVDRPPRARRHSPRATRNPEPVYTDPPITGGGRKRKAPAGKMEGGEGKKRKK
jgi:hypothetical protein